MVAIISVCIWCECQLTAVLYDALASWEQREASLTWIVNTNLFTNKDRIISFSKTPSSSPPCESISSYLMRAEAQCRISNLINQQWESNWSYADRRVLNIVDVDRIEQPIQINSAVLNIYKSNCCFVAAEIRVTFFRIYRDRLWTHTNYPWDFSTKVLNVLHCQSNSCCWIRCLPCFCSSRNLTGESEFLSRTG